MIPRSPTTAAGYPSKRVRRSPTDGVTLPDSNDASTTSPVEETDGQAGGKPGQSSNFRNVSACNRCRLRKGRCDASLPSCQSCEKARQRCVGYDPITKREIPRSYVFYLETRVSHLEHILLANDIAFPPADELALEVRPGPGQSGLTPIDDAASSTTENATAPVHQARNAKEQAWEKQQDESEKLDQLVSNIGMVSVQGASDPRYLGSTSGISFARVVFAAVKSSVSGQSSDKAGVRPSKPPALKSAIGGSSMRDSFFGLQTRPTIKQAPFPDKELGLRLANIYFEYANPQIPILHRGEFMQMLEDVYSHPNRPKTPRESYMSFIVFATGSGIFLGTSAMDEGSATKPSESPTLKRSMGFAAKPQPEEYHASAIVHLEACLSAVPVSERPDGFCGGLEELQAVLLLAGFALLRPVAPGLWYIVGVAVRLAVDLGLHYEDGKDVDTGLDETDEELPTEESMDDMDTTSSRRSSSAKERGRREWTRDLRRRLWWCSYSFDRLVSTCVGRPFGITDQVITTEFPSLLEDKYITRDGFAQPHNPPGEPTYKNVAYHYFRLRLLQSEILQVLQHQQTQMVRADGRNGRNPYMHTKLPSPFLLKFASFRAWRIDIDRRMLEWKNSAPTKRDTGVAFSIDFLDLNYWQMIIMLYRQSLSVPAPFEGEFSTSAQVESPSAHTQELHGDEEHVFFKVAEAGQKVLRLYRSLHRVQLVNYTFLATHHLFMAGISFLYAIWHSPVVRSRLTMDEVDFTILAATSVLGDLIEKCPPAEACRDAFDRMSKATVQMCMSTTGFGSALEDPAAPISRDNKDLNSYFHSSISNNAQFATSNARHQSKEEPRQHKTRTRPRFDMGLNDLFPEDAMDVNVTADMPSTSYTSSHAGSTGTRKLKHEPSQDTAYDASPSSHVISPGYVQNTGGTYENAAIDPSLLPSQGRSVNYSMSSNDTSHNLPVYGDGSTFTEVEAGLQGMEWAGMQMDGGYGQLELGFGFGFEAMGEHDFSEGINNGIDIFDGFFFGAGGGGNGGGNMGF